MHEWITFVLKVLPDLLEGTKVTLQLTLGALFLGAIIGLPASLLRVYGSPWLRRIVGGYVALFRGTPLLIQLFVVYYGLPDLGVTLSRLAAAYATLGLNSGAYQSEYFRGALQSVGSGQMAAARAIGMSKPKALRYIILPQALRLALPAWSNEMIAMIKYTAVVFLIAVPDLMGHAKIISSRYFDPISTYLLVAMIYIVLVAAASLILRFVGQRLKTPGLELDAIR